MKTVKKRSETKIYRLSELVKMIEEGMSLYTEPVGSVKLEIVYDRLSNGQTKFGFNLPVNLNKVYRDDEVPWYEVPSEFPKVVKVKATGEITILTKRIYGTGTRMLDNCAIPYDVNEVSLLSNNELKAIQ